MTHIKSLRFCTHYEQWRSLEDVLERHSYIEQCTHYVCCRVDYGGNPRDHSIYSQDELSAVRRVLYTIGSMQAMFTVDGLRDMR